MTGVYVIQCALVVYLAVAASAGIVGVELDSSYTGTKLSSGWAEQGLADKNHRLELVFAVKQQNLQLLEEVLLNVSDPRHEKYGQHLSNEEVHRLVAPRQSDVDAVKSFLASNNIKWTSASQNQDFITVDVSIEEANLLLNAEYLKYEHQDGHTIHRVRNYSLPWDVAQAVDFVAPTVSVPTVRSPVGSDKVTGNVGSFINDPTSLRKRYKVGNATGSGKSGYKQAVTAFLGQNFAANDLKRFQAKYCASFGGCDTPSGTVPTVGDQEGGGAGMESMLDIEYILGLSGNIDTEFWGFDGVSDDNKQNEPFLKWLMVVSNTSDAKVPKLFSTSYGENEDSCSQARAKRLNAEFIKAGVRGISLLFASGDSGAAGTSGCVGPDRKTFMPQWPSGSPFVTAVGGTAMSEPESTASLSSGGFSNRWSRPAWQREAVDAYKKAAVLPSNPFNDTGRGFPDISAQATNFVIIKNYLPIPGVSGTSAACPTAAGIFGLLNDARMTAGSAPLGFLNPFIYQNLDGFIDITTGHNGGCSGSKGFPAYQGWDAATGVGAPDYPLLLKAILESSSD